jgi:succinyl-CoA synthetase beta subunit
MLIYEYQAKALFNQEGIETPAGFVAETTEELILKLQGLRFPLYLKAQVLSGGRGKAGAVRKTGSAGEAIGVFREIKGMTVKTAQSANQSLVVATLLVEEGQPLIAEFYLAIVMDRARSAPVLIASRKGGMEIETMARTQPENLLQMELEVLQGVTDSQCQRIHSFWGHPKLSLEAATKLLRSLFQAFLKNDATLAEINPLGLTDQGKLVAIDAKMDMDENAAFRHPEWKSYQQQNVVHPEEEEASQYGLSYVKLDNGKIGCMVNGAGLAMATMDLIALYGGKPANFLDVGGRATLEGATVALNLLQRDPSLRAILVNIFGGIVHCDLIAQGILAAAEKIQVNVPLVIRLEGTNADKGLAMIQESGKPWIVARDLQAAVRQAVTLSEGKQCLS